MTGLSENAWALETTKNSETIKNSVFMSLTLRDFFFTSDMSENLIILKNLKVSRP
jgi:hypothetical protein